MDNRSKKVSILALKRLLVEIRDHRPDVCVRYRLIGQMWIMHFLRVADVAERSALFRDEASNRLVTIADLSHVMQFELDKPFQLYQPHFHYDVTNPEEW